MVYLLKKVIFHSYVSYYQRVHQQTAFTKCSTTRYRRKDFPGPWSRRALNNWAWYPICEAWENHTSLGIYVGKPRENHGKTFYAVFLLVNSPAPRFAYGYVNPYADRDGEINRDLRTIAGDVTPLSNTMICLLLFDCWCSAKSSMSSTKQGDVWCCKFYIIAF